MRALLPVLMLLAACSSEPSRAVKPYGADLPPLDANGLPPAYSACVRTKAETTAALYDAFYPCRSELTMYVARMGGRTQEQKAALADDLDKRGLDYAQAQVEARHGSAAVRNASAPVEKPPAPVADSEQKERAHKWAACSLKTIMTAYQQGWDTDPIIGFARSACGYLWEGSPEVADRLYAKMLASVRAGADPGYTVGPSTPAPGEVRM